MNIIIPIGGIGARFQVEGYVRPKPLINVLGRPMIFHVIDNLHLNDDDNLLIVYNGDLDKHGFYETVRNQYTNIKLHKIDNRTRGASETVLYGLNLLTDNELNRKTITIDCDTFYSTDILTKFRNQTDNAVFCFVDTFKDPIYSYVKFNGNTIITDIKEKEKISDFANTGCYCFSSGKLLKQYCIQSLNSFADGSYDQKELYMSGIIRRMIDAKQIFRANIIADDDFHCLGTPLQVKVFCKEYCEKFKKPLRICFDLDNTLVSFPEIKGDYSTVKPIIQNIRICQHLKKLGHTIIIYTARRMKTHHCNVGACIADIGLLTLKTLENFAIPYDEIVFGKPYADFYIDDLGIDAHFDLERELGIYKADVAERSFNTITVKSDNIITKKGETDKIKGEIHWYNHIPTSIKDFFPNIYSYNLTLATYDMEKVSGVPLSYLYVTESMSTKLLENYLDTIELIHDSMQCNEDIDIYANYCEKLEKRYKSYDYSMFTNSTEIFNKLMLYFKDYASKNMGDITVVHGDPVFSNCIVSDCAKFKLIDMRGLQGTKETIFGDKWYDYGKIYQSLIGYDEILLDRQLSIDYKTNMINVFENYISKKYGCDKMKIIKMIANSLLFTLIPLHDNEKDKCQKYFKLITID